MKDLAKVHPDYRERIEALVFEKIPASENFLAEFDVQKTRGYQDYYRIRVGQYRRGCRRQDEILIFYRVKSREEIYSVFP